jgi:hypothetical protein
MNRHDLKDRRLISKNVWLVCPFRFAKPDLKVTFIILQWFYCDDHHLFCFISICLYPLASHLRTSGF